MRNTHGRGSKPMVPFLGGCTTHVRTYFSGDWDVHRGYGFLTHSHMRRKRGTSENGRVFPVSLSQSHPQKTHFQKQDFGFLDVFSPQVKDCLKGGHTQKTDQPGFYSFGFPFGCEQRSTIAWHAVKRQNTMRNSNCALQKIDRALFHFSTHDTCCSFHSKNWQGKKGMY